MCVLTPRRTRTLCHILVQLALVGGFWLFLKVSRLSNANNWAVGIVLFMVSVVNFVAWKAYVDPLDGSYVVIPDTENRSGRGLSPEREWRPCTDWAARHGIRPESGNNGGSGSVRGAGSNAGPANYQ